MTTKRLGLGSSTWNMNSEIFAIKDIKYGNFEYKVTWQGYGNLSSLPKIARMISFAVACGAEEVLLCSKGRSLTVDARPFLCYDDISPLIDVIVSMFAWHLPLSDTEVSIDSVAFAHRDHAEKFIELCDQHIAWNILKTK